MKCEQAALRMMVRGHFLTTALEFYHQFVSLPLILGIYGGP